MDNSAEMKKNGDNAIAYMNEKYGVEFKPIIYDISDYLSDRDTVECYVGGMNPEKEHISIFIDKNDDAVTFHDNYFDFIVRDEVEDYIRSIVEEEFAECKVYKSTNIIPYPDSLKQSNTLSDLYRMNSDYEIWATIYIKAAARIEKETLAKKIYQIAEQLAQDNFIYMIQLFVVGEQVYHSITRFQQNIIMDYYSGPNSVDGENLVYVFDAGIVKERIKVYGRTE